MKWDIAPATPKLCCYNWRTSKSRRVRTDRTDTLIMADIYIYGRVKLDAVQFPAHTYRHPFSPIDAVWVGMLVSRISPSATWGFLV